MASFNPNDYANVAERIGAVYAQFPDARIITENLTTLQDRQVSTWVVKATLFLNAEDQAANLPKATGLAFEVDGGKGVNATSALENAETSSIGRCLAIAGWSGNKKDAQKSLASREEMAKVSRGVTPTAPDFIHLAMGLFDAGDVNGLRLLHAEAVRLNAAPEVLETIKERGLALAAHPAD